MISEAPSAYEMCISRLTVYSVFVENIYRQLYKQGFDIVKAILLDVMRD